MMNMDTNMVLGFLIYLESFIIIFLRCQIRFCGYFLVADFVSLPRVSIGAVTHSSEASVLILPFPYCQLRQQPQASAVPPLRFLNKYYSYYLFYKYLKLSIV